MPGRGEEEGRVGVGKAERARRAVNRHDAIAGDAEALDSAGAAGVEDIDQGAVHGDTGRELPARGNDGFAMKYVNYTILVVPGALILLWIWWHVSVKNWFTGPKTTIDMLPEQVDTTD